MAAHHLQLAVPAKPPEQSEVCGEDEAEDGQALQPLEAPHPGQVAGVVKGQDFEYERSSEPCPPEGRQWLWGEERPELGQTHSLHQADVQAQKGQREGEGAHCLHHPVGGTNWGEQWLQINKWLHNKKRQVIKCYNKKKQISTGNPTTTL